MGWNVEWDGVRARFTMEKKAVHAKDITQPAIERDGVGHGMECENCGMGWNMRVFYHGKGSGAREKKLSQ